MTVKEELHQLVDELAEERAEEALEYLRWLASEGETLSPDELEQVQAGEREIARGEYLTLSDLRRTLSD